MEIHIAIEISIHDLYVHLIAILTTLELLFHCCDFYICLHCFEFLIVKHLF